MAREARAGFRVYLEALVSEPADSNTGHWPLGGFQDTPSLYLAGEWYNRTSGLSGISL